MASDGGSFTVGYNGWAIIHYEPDNSNYFDYNSNNSTDSFLGGKIVQVTGASITRTLNIPLQSSYYLPFNSTSDAKSQIRVAFGTYQFSGEISFELTNGTADNIFSSSFYKRNSLFALQFFDGQNTCTIRNCVWNSLSISCSPGGTVKISISYQSNNGYVSGLRISKNEDLNSSLEYNNDDLLIPYWQCGKANFAEFSVNFSRSVTPKYLNNDLSVPSYLLPGRIEISVNATTIEYIDSWSGDFVINIGKSHSITLNGAILRSSAYQMSSMSDTGSKTYEWTSIVDSVTNPVFTVK